jgi:hypothetical protein
MSPHSRVAAQPGRRTAGSQHSRVAAQPGRRTAGSPHSRFAAQPGRRTVGSLRSRVAAQPGPSRRAAGSPHSRVAAQSSRRTAGQQQHRRLEWGCWWTPGRRPSLHCSRLAREPIVAFSNFFRNAFLLFLSKSTFLFLGTRSCTPKSVPARSQH